MAIVTGVRQSLGCNRSCFIYSSVILLCIFGFQIQLNTPSVPNEYVNSYQQYMYGQSSNIFNPSGPQPTYDMNYGVGSTPSMPPPPSVGGLGVRVGATPPANLPQVTVGSIVKRLKDR